MFSRAAAVCQMTVNQYERIAHSYVTCKRQRDLDMDTTDFSFAMSHYEQ